MSGKMTSGTTWTLDDWTLTLRPIGDDDGPLWLELMRTMSWATRYKRGARRAEDLGPDDVRRAVTPDPEQEIVFVVTASRDHEIKIVGVCRARRQRPDAWEFAIVVLDDWQKCGIGLTLMRAMMDALDARHAERIEGDVLATNKNMLEFLEHLGFDAQPHPEHPHMARVALKLPPRITGTPLSAA
ncbi:MAG: GNAT family N-acetyltransferase [Betaproteobacteria bacterium]|nr:GNAT family N-acetyltransferase [Betaproteobacteria bacterium]